MNDILSNLLEGIDLSKGEADTVIVSLFTCKDVNKVPWQTFSLLKMIFAEVLDMDNNNAEIMAIITAQSLSVANQLVINANDKEITPDDFITSSNKKEMTFEDIKRNLIKKYKLHWTINKKKEDFLKAMGVITSNSDVLTSAASFVHYHCVDDITDETAFQRDLALANLIRLCSINNVYKELKDVLNTQLDINEVVIKNFITEHIDLIFGG